MDLSCHTVGSFTKLLGFEQENVKNGWMSNCDIFKDQFVNVHKLPVAI